MIFNEPEDISMLRDSIRRWLEREAPREKVAEWDRADHMPRSVFDAMADLGLVGLAVPEEYGGSGRDLVLTMVAVEELSRRSIVLGSMFLMAACYGASNVLACGTEEQKQEYLPRLVSGQLIFSLGLSEPNVGADLASVETRAHREGDKVIINGAKRWCTGASMTDYIFCLVRSGAPEERYKNLSFVIIPTNAQGITVSHWPTMGMRGLETNDVNFDNVTLDASYIVGGEAGWNQGWTMLMSSALEGEHLVCGAAAIGIAAQALEETWEYTQERKQFGKPICQIQSIRHMLSECHTKLLASQLMVRNAASLANANQPCAAQLSMAKLFATENCVDIVLQCQRIVGAYGYSTEFHIERYLRDVQATTILGGSLAIHKNNICNRLGLPR